MDRPNPSGKINDVKGCYLSRKYARRMSDISQKFKDDILLTLINKIYLYHQFFVVPQGPAEYLIIIFWFSLIKKVN